jgi:hypothetical protein
MNRAVADGRAHRLARITPAKPIFCISRSAVQRAIGKPSHHLPPNLAHAVDGEVLGEHASDLRLRTISRRARGPIGSTWEIGSTPESRL